MKHLNESQLSELQKVLLAKKQEVTSMMERIESSDPFNDPEASLRSSSPDTDIREDQGHMNVLAQIKSLKDELNHIDIALMKFSQNKYGVCENCGEDIPYGRLQLVPWTSYCVSCEGKMIV